MRWMVLFNIRNGLLMFIGYICEDIMYELKNTYCKSDVAIMGRMAYDGEYAKN